MRAELVALVGQDRADRLVVGADVGVVAVDVDCRALPPTSLPPSSTTAAGKSLCMPMISLNSASVSSVSCS